MTHNRICRKLLFLIVVFSLFGELNRLTNADEQISVPNHLVPISEYETVEGFLIINLIKERLMESIDEESVMCFFSISPQSNQIAISLIPNKSADNFKISVIRLDKANSTLKDNGGVYNTGLSNLKMSLSKIKCTGASFEISNEHGKMLVDLGQSMLEIVANRVDSPTEFATFSCCLIIENSVQDTGKITSSLGSGNWFHLYNAITGILKLELTSIDRKSEISKQFMFDCKAAIEKSKTPSLQHYDLIARPKFPFGFESQKFDNLSRAIELRGATKMDKQGVRESKSPSHREGKD